ncbi:hypothetical protein BC831DRAFT_114996 [Entophlyctis helioformis]|nr:hypothetical protein BC831DRAFT_114996 [Entophlyctis helioformis]
MQEDDASCDQSEELSVEMQDDDDNDDDFQVNPRRRKSNGHGDAQSLRRVQPRRRPARSRSGEPESGHDERRFSSRQPGRKDQDHGQSKTGLGRDSRHSTDKSEWAGVNADRDQSPRQWLDDQSLRRSTRHHAMDHRDQQQQAGSDRSSLTPARPSRSNQQRQQQQGSHSRENANAANPGQTLSTANSHKPFRRKTRNSLQTTIEAHVDEANFETIVQSVHDSNDQDTAQQHTRPDCGRRRERGRGRDYFHWGRALRARKSSRLKRPGLGPSRYHGDGIALAMPITTTKRMMRG